MALAQQMPCIVVSATLRDAAETAQDLGGYPLDGWALHFPDSQAVLDFSGSMDRYVARGWADYVQVDAPRLPNAAAYWMGAVIVLDPWVRPHTLEFRRLMNGRQAFLVNPVLVGQAEAGTCECEHARDLHRGRPVLLGWQEDGWVMPDACTAHQCRCSRFRQAGEP